MQTAGATGLSATYTTDEYGKSTATSTPRYGYLGDAQLSADNPGGLITMGVRLYNPTTGRFLSVDPLYGGSANQYDYCYGDPINCRDLDGKMAALALVGAAGLVLETVLIVVGWVILVAIAAAAVWYGVKWAKNKLNEKYDTMHANKSAHAADQAKARGISDDMIDQAIKTGKKTAGNEKGTVKYKGQRVWVVVNTKTSVVISVGWN